ncbi:MAG: HypC/HybG/HupF family hydrogenase formation chaperone [Firmicutes bacterium]|nr:HypC/HybG/HupF family hydrogenase formation chaperone [Bacillota bacterium]
MCLAVPGRIRRIADGYAEIDYGGLCKRASLRLVPQAKVDDIVLVHAGFVLQILEQSAGEELERLIIEMIGSADED